MTNEVLPVKMSIFISHIFINQRREDYRASEE